MMKKLDFFEDMAVALDSWTDIAVDAITNPLADLGWTENEEPYHQLQAALGANKIDRESLRHIFAECFRGLSVSFLTILDGGTNLANHGRLYLVNEDGERIGEGLHNEFVGHLMDTSRL